MSTDELAEDASAIRIGSPDACERLREMIDSSAHLLPTQGPITVFVHHNTLHAFEHQPFDEAITEAGRLYGCHAMLPEVRYRRELARGRIQVADLEAALIDDLGDTADRFIGTFGTRYALRLAMLQYPIHSGTTYALRWTIAETDALRRFRSDVAPTVRQRMIAAIRTWFLAELPDSATGDMTKPASRSTREVLDNLTATFGGIDRGSMDSWSEAKWESFVLNFLWHTCQQGVRAAGISGVEEQSESPRRHRDILLEATGEDADQRVNEILIPFCAAFLDQGFVEWELPDRDQGLWVSFLHLFRRRTSMVTSRLRGLRKECRRLLEDCPDPLESIDESLRLLGVPEGERPSFITDSLLALRGWAGMIRQMESNAEWMPRPAPDGSLIEFLAVRLMLDRLAIEQIARDRLGQTGPLRELRESVAGRIQPERSGRVDQLAFVVFQLAQLRGWSPEDLQHLSHRQWESLTREIDAFSGLERRRIFHHAYERRYRNTTLDALAAHTRRLRESSDAEAHEPPARSTPPVFQVACCLDDREESFRRHLEEVDPECETLGIAGFFGVAMYYRGVSDADFQPLCPVNIKPQHHVIEAPLYSHSRSERRRAEARRRIGWATHHTHRGTRGVLGGLVTGLLGSLAAFPLVARVLFPRTTARIRRLCGGIVQPPATELLLERLDTDSGTAGPPIGYTLEEMAGIVEGGLRSMGLGRSSSFSPLVILCGHGSSSRNNPHEAAYNCGACGGGRGGPNARAFAQMANDERVRRRVADRGLEIPHTTYFIGSYHDTCDDSITWYDLDRMPVRCRSLFERARGSLDVARRRNAHERSRRFESAELSMDSGEALRHVEGRSQDLSQTRPECGHATNALCFVGHRWWSRGLFLDRRAFLTSYDITQDDDRGTLLENLLQAVIPVCAGINLEYWFSYVDDVGYGCGTKLPHNITSLLGVMDGASSDLRPGLPRQMTEIHEPVRLMFVIETNRGVMRRILDANEALAGLIYRGWVQLAILDPRSSQIELYSRGEFVPYEPGREELPLAPSSLDWYGGRRDNLGFATIDAHCRPSEEKRRPPSAGTAEPSPAALEGSASR